MMMNTRFTLYRARYTVIQVGIMDWQYVSVSTVTPEKTEG